MKAGKLLRYVSPLIYIIFGSLGLYSYISVFCLFDYQPSKHPYSHPFFVIAGSISLILCIAAFALDIIVYSREEKKLRRFAAEVSVTLCMFVVFMFVWGTLEEWFSGLGEVIF